MRTLVQRGYVAEVATDPGPGQATLFGTTSLFLANLGLDTISQLPPLGDLVPGADIMEALEASLSIDGETGRPVRTPSRSSATKTEADAESDAAMQPVGDAEPEADAT